jgi:hypothetical protein
MCTVMLGLPLTSVLLATLLLEADGAQVMPLVIVAVVVAYVVTAHLTPVAPAEPEADVHPHRVMTPAGAASALDSTTAPREKADV